MAKIKGNIVATKEITPGTPSFSIFPAGIVLAYGGTSSPSGGLICNGSTASRTTYASLFSIVGIAYGNGDGSTTFHLPDLRGRIIRGFDNGAANDPDRASRTASNTGGNTGDNVGSLQSDQYGLHNHNTSNDGAHTHNIKTEFGTNQVNQGAPNGTYNQVSASLSYINTVSVQTTNSNHNHTITSAGGNETRMKNVSCNYLITTGGQ